MSFSDNRVPQAEIGDFVAYDWEADGHLDHLAFIVAIAPGQYPVVSEWGLTSWGRPSPYQLRGWTWSALSNKWLQAKRPRVRAMLVHIRGGHY